MSVSGVAAARLAGEAPRSLLAGTTNPESAVFLAIWAHHDGDPDTALAAARRATELDPDREFARLLARYLDTGHTRADHVYDTPAAFQAFIRGGGNVRLYSATHEALRRHHRRFPAPTVLDVGVGDGTALLPVLDARLSRVDVVEPSGELLARTRAGLAESGVPHRVRHARIEDVQREWDGERWNVVQSTFAFDTLPPDRRSGVLEWIRDRCDSLVLVVFDVPDTTRPFSPEWFLPVLAKAEQGIREYTEHRDLVGLGFLVPVVLGFFDAGNARANYEQSVSSWEAELRNAGFGTVSSHHLCDYWWQPAHLVEAAR
ncbi:methyltransferase domain-containing protein [Actinoalloteichus spitiensis]|uniref:methyltransferase domain-containing protein n=1 Tax=Actinoalloteichus spitiensis TaxID=252394 RepID=UPI00035D0F50|nr:class I SAM-dependent methyltransferase [Actinoalloteichus spitiensis]